MDANFLNILYKKHQEAKRIPSKKMVCTFLNNLLSFMFPSLGDSQYESERVFRLTYDILYSELQSIFEAFDTPLPDTPQQLTRSFFGTLPKLHDMLMEDANAICEGDPAACSVDEVIRTYPGFLAIAVHRMAHELYNMKIPILPRILSEEVHSYSGIDIHPGAQIGSRFCIDHGTGVVIGETTQIGDNVKVYQGVTLGALSVEKSLASSKRHPTIEEGVVIYANATILGGATVIGANSIIGGSVWVTKSVAPGSKLFHQPDVKLITI